MKILIIFIGLAIIAILCLDAVEVYVSGDADVYSADYWQLDECLKDNEALFVDVNSVIKENE